mmetsp:Transcript_35915/g.74735  ORF Transcript_35915/g.74735 Transcript_35915/m.74735 type:complete len:466 (+) Transcript_35915:47-1444(+)
MPRLPLPFALVAAAGSLALPAPPLPICGLKAELIPRDRQQVLPLLFANGTPNNLHSAVQHIIHQHLDKTYVTYIFSVGKHVQYYYPTFCTMVWAQGSREPCQETRINAAIPPGGYSDIAVAQINRTTHVVLIAGDAGTAQDGSKKTTDSVVVFFDGAFSAPVILKTSSAPGTGHKAARGANLLWLPPFAGSSGELIRPEGPTAVVSGQLGTQFFAPRWTETGLTYRSTPDLTLATQGTTVSANLAAALVDDRTLVLTARSRWRDAYHETMDLDAPNFVYKIQANGILQQAANFSKSCQSVGISKLSSIAPYLFAVANGGEADCVQPNHLLSMPPGAAAPTPVSTCAPWQPMPANVGCKSGPAVTRTPVPTTDADNFDTRTRKVLSATHNGSTYVLTVNSCQTSYVIRYEQGVAVELFQFEESNVCGENGDSIVRFVRGGDIACFGDFCRVALTLYDGDTYLYTLP